MWPWNMPYVRGSKHDKAQININKGIENETRKWEREACSAFGFPSKKNKVVLTDDIPTTNCQGVKKNRHPL